MTGYLVIISVGALAVVVLTELMTAVLPVIIVIALVPPEEREGLAKLLAACDSSRKLRLWPALRLAVRARREEARRHRADGPAEASYHRADGPAEARHHGADGPEAPVPAGRR